MQHRWEKAILFLLDFISIELAFITTFMLRFKVNLPLSPFTPSLLSYLLPSIIVTFFLILLFMLFNLYDRPNWQTSVLDESFSIFKAVFIAFLIITVLFTDITHPLTRGKITLLWFAITSFIFPLFFRTLYRRMIIALHKKGKLLLNTVIIAPLSSALKTREELYRYPELGYNIVGFIDYPESQHVSQCEEFNCLGQLKDLPNIIERDKITEIILAFPTKDHEQIIKVMDYASAYPVSFKAVPDMYDLITGQKQLSIWKTPLIELLPEPLSTFQKFLKNSMDISISLFGIIITLPITVSLLAIIPIHSKGNPVYSQMRVGKRGKVFLLYKFRTMVSDAEKNTGPVWALEDDPRITPLGKFLRKSRLDELPQLFNILKGDMSLVGPRPERPYFVKQLKREIPLYSKRLLVKPGLTGLAQVKHKYDSSLSDVAQKLKFDLYYIENFSILIDVKILFRTFWVMLFAKGAR